MMEGDEDDANSPTEPQLKPLDTAIFIGDSEDLVEVRGWAGAWCCPVEIPHRWLLCAVADQDMLDGLCTAREAAILHRVRVMDIPCVTPGEAREFRTSAVDRRLRAAPILRLT